MLSYDVGYVRKYKNKFMNVQTKHIEQMTETGNKVLEQL